MDNVTTYDYAKLDKLPRFLGYPCKKSDVDSLLNELNLEPPFQTLYMTKGPNRPASKKRPLQKLYLVMLADNRPNNRIGVRSPARALHVYAVPDKMLSAVRSLIVPLGLKKILMWLTDCQRRSESWQLQEHSVALLYDTAKNEMIFAQEYLKNADRYDGE